STSDAYWRLARDAMNGLHPGARLLSFVVLAARGLRRVDCEGGPGLFARLVAADLVDQLCLTVAPLLVAGTAGRIAAGAAPAAARRLALASILVEDGFTFLRYRRDAG
ncbi:dihydrofolate reductase family protein, partial [Amycolatopsis mediterranei]|uniref:dihydrofolate reductase family protein n=1 Tax=Amycolatopsis mediterranei TaxID=33910 RepID=UPI003330070B